VREQEAGVHQLGRRHRQRPDGDVVPHVDDARDGDRPGGLEELGRALHPGGAAGAGDRVHQARAVPGAAAEVDGLVDLLVRPSAEQVPGGGLEHLSE
jgi:hypothetical protein